MSKGSELLAIAAREIGYREGKNNDNKFGVWFGLNYEPWCMIFVQWVYSQAGIPLPYKTGSCGMLLNWYKSNKPECVTKNPIPGCIVIFDFPKTAYTTDHTGLFVTKTDTKITTIDGNTSGNNDSNGEWVQQKTRDLKYANPVYIIPEALMKSEEQIDIDKFINDISPEQAEKLIRKAEQYRATLLPDKYAEEACKKAVKSGYFSDGDSNDCLDNPQGVLKREDYVLSLDRMGLLGSK